MDWKRDGLKEGLEQGSFPMHPHWESDTSSLGDSAQFKSKNCHLNISYAGNILSFICIS